MKHSSLCVVIASVVGLSAAGHAAPPPIEAFGQLPTVIDVDLNPAGTRLAWVEDTGKQTRIVIHDLVARKELRTLRVPVENRARRVLWANDETLLIDQRVAHSVAPNARDLREWQRWTAVDAAGGEARVLLMTGGNRDWVTGASLVRRNTSKAGKVLMSTLDFSNAHYRPETGSRLAGGKKDGGWIESLYEVDLATGNGRLVVSGSPFTLDWLADASLERVVRSEWLAKEDRFEILLKNGAGWRRLHRARGCGRLSLVAFAADAAAILVRGPTCEDRRNRLWSLPLDGTPIKLLLDESAPEVMSVHLDPLDDSLLAVGTGGDAPTVWLDTDAERRTERFKRTFSGKTSTLVARSADHQRVVVHVQSSAHPPVYYLVDYGAKTADIINEAYPRLADVKLGAVREFRYAARDEYALLAYLTFPPDAAEKNLPLVVLPHGGPEARDHLDFDWLSQFLASRGYAVLQPQFRGSSGFGSAHADAGRRQWGLRMQDDVTDGVRALIERGIADPKRICIAGWSYGGYSALAGAAFTPELYACAASIAGVSDLPIMLSHEGKGDKESNSLAYWREHIGSPFDEHVIARSPARHAAAVRAPVLLVHGLDDTVVPVEQSRMMARALARLKKPYELVELPGDDHHLSASETRIRMLTELEKFLAAHLGASPAPN